MDVERDLSEVTKVLKIPWTFLPKALFSLIRPITTEYALPAKKEELISAISEFRASKFRDVTRIIIRYKLNAESESDNKVVENNGKSAAIDRIRVRKNKKNKQTKIACHDFVVSVDEVFVKFQEELEARASKAYAAISGKHLKIPEDDNAPIIHFDEYMHFMEKEGEPDD